MVPLTFFLLQSAEFDSKRNLPCLQLPKCLFRAGTFTHSNCKAQAAGRDFHPGENYPGALRFLVPYRGAVLHCRLRLVADAMISKARPGTSNKVPELASQAAETKPPALSATKPDGAPALAGGGKETPICKIGMTHASLSSNDQEIL